MIWPLPVVIGKTPYPDGILEALKDKARVNVINATDMAEELGNPKVMNVILLGAVVKSMKLDDIDWPGIIAANVKPKFVDINIEAFERGGALV